jgi:hypothetical protein
MGRIFDDTWDYCSSLTSFPAINTQNGTNFYAAWQNCTSLTSFPAINTQNGIRVLASLVQIAVL